MVPTPADSYLARTRVYMGARYSQDTIQNTIGHADRFLRIIGVQSTYTRDDLLRYLDTLISAQYHPRSIQTIVAGVHTMFIACQLPWPLDRRDMHLGIPAAQPVTPLLTDTEIGSLIHAARAERSTERAVAALATIWGLRSSEMAIVLAAGLDGKTLTVQSLKGGEVRRHTIPVVLAPILTIRPYRITRRGLHEMFDRLMDRAGRPSQTHEGWHACRRSVVTGLIRAGVPEHVITRFMGWKLKGATAWIYWHPDEKQDIDQVIYAGHPYLPLWARA